MFDAGSAVFTLTGHVVSAPFERYGKLVESARAQKEHVINLGARTVTTGFDKFLSSVGLVRRSTVETETAVNRSMEGIAASTNKMAASADRGLRTVQERLGTTARAFGTVDESASAMAKTVTGVQTRVDEKISKSAEVHKGYADTVVRDNQKIVASNKEIERSAAGGGIGGGGRGGGAAAAAAGAGAASEKQAQRTTKAWKDGFNTLAGIGKWATISLLAIGGVSVKFAADFDRQMTLVQTQAGYSAKEVAGLRKQVLNLAPAVGIGPAELAKGLFHVASSGIPASKAMDVLKFAAIGAKVGMANMEDTTNALVAVLNTAPKDIHSTAEAMGVMNDIVGHGNLRMEDLTKALTTGVLPAAKGVGLGMRDLGAALDTLTARGVPAEQASTRLRTTLTLIANPTAKAQKALAELGFSQDRLAKDMREHGLVFALQDLQNGLDRTFSHGQRLSVEQEREALMKYGQQLQNAGVSGKALTKDLTLFKEQLDKSGTGAIQASQLITSAFGGARMGTTMLTLMQNIGDVRKHMDELNKADAAGRLQAAWQRTQKEFSVQASQMVAGLKEIIIQLGQYLIPALKALAVALMDAGKWLGHHKVLAEALAVVFGTVLTAAILAFFGRLAAKTVEGLANLGRLGKKLAYDLPRDAAKGAAGVAERLGLIGKDIDSVTLKEKELQDQAEKTNATLAGGRGPTGGGAVTAEEEAAAGAGGLGIIEGMITGIDGVMAPGSIANPIAVLVVDRAGAAPAREARAAEGGVAQVGRGARSVDEAPVPRTFIAGESGAAELVPGAAAGGASLGLLSRVGGGLSGAFGLLKTGAGKLLTGGLKGLGIASIGALGAQLGGAAIGGHTGHTVGDIGSLTATGAGLGAAAGSVVPGLGTVIGGAIGGGVGLAAGIIKDIKPVREAVGGLWKGIEGGASTAASAIGHAFSTAFGAVGHWVSGAAKTVGDFFSHLADSIAKSQVGKAAAKMAREIGDFFGAIGHRAGQAGHIIAEAFSWAFKEIKKIFSPIVNFIGGIFSDAIGKKASGPIGLLIGHFHLLWSAAKSVFSSIGTVISTTFHVVGKVLDAVFVKTGILKALWTVLEKTVTTIFHGIENVISGVFRIIGGIFEVFASVIEGKWGKAWKAVKGIVGGAAEIVKGIVGIMGSFVVGVFDGLGKPLIHAFDAALNFIEGLPKRAWNAAWAVGHAIIGGLGTIGDGLISVIKDGINYGLIAPLNWIIDRINSIPHVSLPIIGKVGLPHIGHIAKLQGGGFVPGDPNRDGTLAALSGKEFVATAHGQQMMESAAPGLLNFIAQNQRPHPQTAPHAPMLGSTTGVAGHASDEGRITGALSAKAPGSKTNPLSVVVLASEMFGLTSQGSAAEAKTESQLASAAKSVAGSGGPGATTASAGASSLVAAVTGTRQSFQGAVVPEGTATATAQSPAQLLSLGSASDNASKKMQGTASQAANASKAILGLGNSSKTAESTMSTNMTKLGSTVATNLQRTSKTTGDALATMLKSHKDFGTNMNKTADDHYTKLHTTVNSTWNTNKKDTKTLTDDITSIQVDANTTDLGNANSLSSGMIGIHRGMAHGVADANAKLAHATGEILIKMDTATWGGVSEVFNELNKALDSLQAGKHVNIPKIGDVTASVKGGLSGVDRAVPFNLGGMLPGAEFGRGDVMTLVDPTGTPRAKMAGDEAIFNRWQMPYVDAGLQMLGFRGAEDLWRSVNTAHGVGYEKGGRLPGFDTGGYVFPFPKNQKFTWARVDQGQDLQTVPGGVVLAIAPGNVRPASDRFGGFGGHYAEETITGGPLAGRGVYYGHIWATKFGGVSAGDIIGRTQTAANQWTAAPAGWLELGFLPYGSMSAGNAIAPILHALAAGHMVAGMGGIGGISWSDITAPKIKGIKGPLARIGQGAINKATGAANSLGQKIAATLSPTANTNFAPGSGSWLATAYGPPWGGIEGGGITATGVRLPGSPTGHVGPPFIIAVDPSVIPLHSKVKVWPNPANDPNIIWAAEDTGGAIKGHHIDFLDLSGRAHQDAWGSRNVNVTKAAKGGWLGRFAAGGRPWAPLPSSVGSIPGFRPPRVRRGRGGLHIVGGGAATSGGTRGAGGRSGGKAPKQAARTKQPLSQVTAHVLDSVGLGTFVTDQNRLGLLDQQYTNQENLFNLFDAVGGAGLPQADLDVLMGIREQEWDILYKEWKTLPEAIDLLQRRVTALQGHPKGRKFIPPKPRVRGHAPPRKGHFINQPATGVQGAEQEITDTETQIKGIQQGITNDTRQMAIIHHTVSGEAMDLADRYASALSAYSSDLSSIADQRIRLAQERIALRQQSASINSNTPVGPPSLSSLVNQVMSGVTLNAPSPSKQAAEQKREISRQITGLASQDLHLSTAAGQLRTQMKQVTQAKNAAARRLRRNGFDAAWAVQLNKWRLQDRLTKLKDRLARLKSLLKQEQGLLKQEQDALTQLRSWWTGGLQGNTAISDSLSQAAFNLLDLYQLGADMPTPGRKEPTLGTVEAVLRSFGLQIPEGLTQGLQTATQAYTDFQAFQASRATLFSQFGSNFQPAGVSPLRSSASIGAGPQFWGAGGGADAGFGTLQVMAGGGPLKARHNVAPGGTTINIENNFAAGPPDPHTWSAGVGFELAAQA